MANAQDPPPRHERSGRRGRRKARYAHARRPARTWPRRAGFTVAVLAIASGLVLGAHIFLFYQHSDRSGRALIHAEQRAAAVARAKGSCTSQLPPTTGTGAAAVSASGAALGADGPTGIPVTAAPSVYALLRAPSIGLVAPVVEGVDTPQLSVAVGHVPASSWPGASGTSVLAAHDVTWFSRIDKLAPGQQVSLSTPCQTFDYTVEDHKVVAAGTPIYQTALARLVLITCYPLDALFLTSQRYVLDAALTRVVDAPSGGTRVIPPHAAPVAPPTVPAPAPLASEGLDLDHNPAPLGSLVVSGSPAVGWQQSSQPLDDERAVLELYFAALRSAGQDQPAWWAAVAPGVPFTAASHLVGATITHNDVALSPSLDVRGSALTAASLTAEPVLSGSDDPGAYRIQMTAAAENGQLVVSGWTMQRVG